MKSTDIKERRRQADLEDRFSKIYILLKKIDGHFEDNDIHDYRVEIKKLKAMIRLFNSKAPESTTCSFPKKLNKIYKALGHLREWQIQGKKIESSFLENNFSRPISYIHKISRQTDLQIRRVGKLLRQFRRTEKNKQWIKRHFTDTISDETKKAFIQQNMKIVHALLLAGSCDDDSMHYMRKMLKDVQYTLSDSEKESALREGSSLLKTIQAVSGRLGELHDMHVALDFLDKELKSGKNKSGEKIPLRTIRSSWQIEKDEIRKETLKSIKEIDLAFFPTPASGI